MDRTPERLTKQQRQERIMAELRINPVIDDGNLNVHIDTRVMGVLEAGINPLRLRRSPFSCGENP